MESSSSGNDSEETHKQNPEPAQSLKPESESRETVTLETRKIERSEEKTETMQTPVRAAGSVAFSGH
jgi:hypothetical protein